MNLVKIFNAVDNDEMNSPLVSICNEIERQGYCIKLEGVEITSNELAGNIFTDLENAVNEFNIEVEKKSKPAQKLKLVFTDYHKFNIQSYN